MRYPATKKSSKPRKAQDKIRARPGRPMSGHTKYRSRRDQSHYRGQGR